jgi:GTP-binding protein
MMTEAASDDQLDSFTPEEVEKGRLLFAGECQFIAASNSLNNLPPLGLPEVAFAGRSNVGKSSLVNALTGRRTLARASQTPGRTRQLIFFSLADRLQLVDLPGYGYAKAPKTDIKAWTKLTRQFLGGRASLQRMFLLIDARRGVGSGDEEMMKLMDEAAVPWAAVLTKMDKVKIAEQKSVMEKTTQKINRHVAAYPHVWPTSSETGKGIAELRAHLASYSTA